MVLNAWTSKVKRMRTLMMGGVSFADDDGVRIVPISSTSNGIEDSLASINL